MVFGSIATVIFHHCIRDFRMKHALIVIAALALPLSLVACSKPAEETTEATTAPMADVAPMTDAAPAVEAEVATTDAVAAAEAAVDVPAAEATATPEAAPVNAPY